MKTIWKKKQNKNKANPEDYTQFLSTILEVAIQESWK